MTKHLIVTIIAVLLTSTASAAATTLIITGSNVKDGTLTGLDVKTGSIYGSDIHDRSLTTTDLALNSVYALQATPLTTVDTQTTVQPGTHLSIAATCPDGYAAVGGGGWHAGGPDIYNTGNYPNAFINENPYQWRYDVTNPTGIAAGAAAYAICAYTG